MHINAAISPLNSSQKPFPLWLRIGFWICTTIAVAVVIRRLFALAAPPRSSAAPQLAALDHFFASHAALTLAHIIPALAFVLVAPFVVFRRQSVWAERLIFPLGAVVGITAYAISSHAIGGWIERSAVLFFNGLFLFALLRAFFCRRRKEPQRTRIWLLRAIAILLGIATTRPVMGVFFATSPLTHLTPRQFFGVAFWIGFSINTLVFELWLRSRSRHQQTMPLQPVDDDLRAQLRRIS
ncbi:MAG: DUF2306 domain-containing protein [Silvibacterium sp.]|nr:DUF2306 domain-containing protein [Silvibacterium sp.]